MAYNMIIYCLIGLFRLGVPVHVIRLSGDPRHRAAHKTNRTTIVKEEGLCWCKRGLHETDTGVTSSAQCDASTCDCVQDGAKETAKEMSAGAAADRSCVWRGCG